MRQFFIRGLNQRSVNCDSRILERLCLCGSLLAIFCETCESKLPSIRIFVFRETTKFLFTLQARQFAYILLQVLNCTLFSCIWIAFWSQTPNERASSAPPCRHTHYIFADHFSKDNLNPTILALPRNILSAHVVTIIPNPEPCFHYPEFCIVPIHHVQSFNSGFLIFSEGIERGQRHKMD